MDPGGLVLTLLIIGIGFLILFGVIRSAVGSSLEEHYRIVRLYEATGEWNGRKPDPRAIPAEASATTDGE